MTTEYKEGYYHCIQCKKYVEICEHLSKTNKCGYESDDCICYFDFPENCKSKLEHYCCCNIYDKGECLAKKHDDE